MTCATDCLRSIDRHNGPWPLHGAAATRVLEAAALAASSPHALMLRAGTAVARLAMAMAPHARLVEFWAGPGNNGGDALVAARALHERGIDVRVVLLADPRRLPADAADALRRATEAGVPISSDIHAAPTAALIVDGLLGLGLRRAPEGDIARAIAVLNAATPPILAIDLPSGLHPDFGMPVGEAALRATCTLALLTLKPGLFTAGGRDHAGQVWFDALGCDGSGADAWLGGPAPAMQRLHAVHKGSFGDVLVVGGAPGMVGAAWLAARAALAAGAGRVHVSLLDEQAGGFDGGRPELMARPGAWRETQSLAGTATVVAGCGGGEAIRAALPTLLMLAPRLVLDADALNAVASDPTLQSCLRSRGASSRATVLTPHPLEAARLLGVPTTTVQGDRLGSARTLAERFDCTVLLKGSGSVVASPGALPHVNPSGNGLLATAGTGDVLAGWLAGSWAGQAATEAGAVAAAAAWRHGAVADRAAERGQLAPLRAADLIEAMVLDPLP